MTKENKTMWALVVLFAVMMSLPYMVPHTGFLALFGFIPLLCMERLGTFYGKKKLWHYHYPAFVLWNAITTFWVCNATIGGGIFACLANALQMSLVFGLFRLSKKHFKGVLPYIFLAAAWIAWERWYFVKAEISWPWLSLGNAFARSIEEIQWYEFTGTIGGTLWVWLSNLGIFGLMVALSDGSWAEKFNIKAKIASVAGVVLVIVAPLVWSAILWNNYEETDEKLDVLIAQPNIDPYHKFEALKQEQQDAILEDLIKKPLSKYEGDALLILAPETFTRPMVVGNYGTNCSWRRFTNLLAEYPGVNMLFGASTWDVMKTTKRPSVTARSYGDTLFTESHNSAVMIDGSARTEIFHKSKLVVGTELTPYPKIFVPLDNLLGGVMGRDIGQKEISLLNVVSKSGKKTPIGCAVCYESVYGEYCTGYVRKGAKALAVITNDAWWGNTPGYKQHCSYSSLRAIETRRDIARCANTGISCIVNARGELLQKSPWWESAVVEGKINLREGETFFVRYGDITGRVCSFFFVFLLLLLVVKFITEGNGLGQSPSKKSPQGGGGKKGRKR